METQKKEPTVCGFCKKEFKNLLKCSQCLSMHQCSKECQKSDWQSHKSICLEKPISIVQIAGNKSSNQILSMKELKEMTKNKLILPSPILDKIGMPIYLIEIKKTSETNIFVTRLAMDQETGKNPYSPGNIEGEWIVYRKDHKPFTCGDLSVLDSQMQTLVVDSIGSKVWNNKNQISKENFEKYFSEDRKNYAEDGKRIDGFLRFRIID